MSHLNYGCENCYRNLVAEGLKVSEEQVSTRTSKLNFTIIEPLPTTYRAHNRISLICNKCLFAFERSYLNLKHEVHCPMCEGNELPDGFVKINNRIRDKIIRLEIANYIASERGWQCLSNEYSSKLKFQCRMKHPPFKKRLVELSKSGCPICNKTFYLGEEICRITFESLFKSEFPKKRLPWLRNSRGNLMELDGYCEKLKIGFEHQGDHHYKRIKRYNKRRSLKTIKEDDKLKLELCKINGVKLLVIDDVPSKTKIADLKQVINRQLDYKLTEAQLNLKINYDSIFDFDQAEEISRIVEENFGTVINMSEIISSNSKIELKCEITDHAPFLITISSLRKGSWCSECAHAELGRSKALDNFNSSKKLLSKSQIKVQTTEAEYRDKYSNVSCKCKHNHKFEVPLYKLNQIKLKYGSAKYFCPDCLKKYLGKYRVTKIKKEISKLSLTFKSPILLNDAKEKFHFTCKNCRLRFFENIVFVRKNFKKGTKKICNCR